MGLTQGPGAACRQPRAHGVAVIGAIGEQDVAVAKAAEHVVGRAPVMRLPLGQLQEDRQAERIDERVDLGRQAAARQLVFLATHAGGIGRLFLALAACWWTRIDEESIIWMSPS